MTAMRVLFLSPGMSAMATGEDRVAFKWAEALAERVELTVLTQQGPNPPHAPVEEQLPNAEVVTWPAPSWRRAKHRIVTMLKPDQVIYNARARRWIRQALADGRRFDIAHQIMPQAARYATPLAGSGIPYIFGPLGGALDTPGTFAAENSESAPWFTRLRALDHWRLRHDPMLRRSYAGAEVMLGVAPYVQDLLSPVPIKRFEVVLELGIDALPSEDELPPRVPAADGALRLLHVGRGVRTKGLRDVIRAMGQLTDLPGITLVSAGDGPDLPICRAEAERLGVADRIRFEGQVPRARVEELYREADVFAFPSFREPAGNVVYEAMRNALPVIAADRGGPASIVDEETGIKVPVTDPQTYARDIAAAIRALHDDPARRMALGQGGQAKLHREGRWTVKADHLVELYRSVVENRG